jgi:hypothetical protein
MVRITHFTYFLLPVGLLDPVRLSLGVLVHPEGDDNGDEEEPVLQQETLGPVKKRA